MSEEYCPLELTGQVFYEMRCPKCNAVVTSKYQDPSKRKHKCRASATTEPGFVTKAASATAAYATWIAAGSPTRTDEEIAAIYDLCTACPEFKPSKQADRGHCKKCGCPLRKLGGLRNKIRMATEHCPLEKW